MNSKIQTKGQKSNFCNVSIYQLIHQGISQHRGRLQEMIDAYNTDRPVTTITDSLGRTRSYRKGVIRGSKSKLAEQLIYLCLRQMEALRVSENPQDLFLYQSYLESDRLPVITNRLELANLQKANGSQVCKSTINNHLKALQDAGIILKKRNTSRQRRWTEDSTLINEVCENGRGDFQLFLNKRIFHFHLEYDFLCTEAGHQSDVETTDNGVEKPQNKAPGAAKAAPPAENGAIEDQAVSKPSAQSLAQLIPNSTNTKKSINNNSGKVHCTPSGVPAGQLNDVSELHSERYELERDSINPGIVAARRGENRPVGAPAAALDAREQIQRYREVSEQRRLLSSLVARLLPGEERKFYLQMLQVLFISLLYPDLNRSYLQRIQPDILRLLGLYLDLVPSESPKEGFRKLSRAIEMVFRYRQKHQHYRLYDPLSFLRMDYKGGFHTVVTEWLPKETFKLKMYADKRSHLIKWQQGQAYADDLFDGVVEALRTGLYNSQSVFVEAQKRLNRYLGRIKAADKTKNRIKESFKARFQHLYRELITQAEEKEDVLQDPTWKSFVTYLNLINVNKIKNE